jgi:mono/diheme cytochrome c family protein
MSAASKKQSLNVAAEPVAGSAPAPVWLYVLLGVLVFWGMRYLDEQGGGFGAKVYRPHRSMAELQAMLPKSEGDVLFANGQRVYTTYCSVCHQPTGQGLPGQFPPLVESEWVLAAEPGRIIRLVLDGIQGPITVKGQAFNGAMPPWRELLKDEEIAAVLTYIRQNKNWGNAASAVSPARVKAVRDKVAARPAWSADELLAIPETD